MAFDPRSFLDAGAASKPPQGLPFDENDFRTKRKRLTQWDDYVDMFAKAYGDDLPDFPNLVKAVIMRESGGNATAVSPAGAGGLMQMMPGTFMDMGGADPEDRFNPVENLDKGVRYLAEQYRRFGTPEKALAAYNAGPGNVEKHGGIPPFKETQAYVPAVLGYFNALGRPEPVRSVPNSPGIAPDPQTLANSGAPDRGAIPGRDPALTDAITRSVTEIEAPDAPPPTAFDPESFLKGSSAQPDFMAPNPIPGIPGMGGENLPATAAQDGPKLSWDPAEAHARFEAEKAQQDADAARGREFLDRKRAYLAENPMGIYTPEKDAALQQGHGKDNRSFLGRTAGDIVGAVEDVTQNLTSGARGGYDAAMGARARTTEENLAEKEAGIDSGFLQQLKEAGQAMVQHPDVALREIGLSLVEDAPVNALATFGLGAILRGTKAVLGARKAGELAKAAQRAGKGAEVVARAQRMGETAQAVRRTEETLTKPSTMATIGREVGENVAGAATVSSPQAEAQGRTYGPADAFQDVVVGTAMGAPLGLLRAAKDTRISRANFDKVKDVALVAGMEKHPAVKEMLPRFRALAESPDMKGVRFKVDAEDAGRKHWTREELDAAGYQDRAPGTYEAAGETGKGQIILRKTAGPETQVEEAAHFLQDRLRAKAQEEGNQRPGPYRKLQDQIRGWEESVRAEAKQEGMKLPEGDELFAQAFTAHMGYADKFPETVRRVVMPDPILDGFRKLMGEDPALRGAAERPQGDITGKGLKPENTPVEAVEEIFRGTDRDARQKWLRVLYPEYAPGGAIGVPARRGDPVGYAIGTEMASPDDPTYKPVSPRDIDVRRVYQQRVAGPLEAKQGQKPVIPEDGPGVRSAEMPAPASSRFTPEESADAGAEWDRMAAAGATPFQLKPESRYQLAGPKAEGFDAAERRGEVFPGKYDGKPRFEIDDSRATWTPRAQERFGAGKTVFSNLGESLDHKDLYRNYPQLAKVPVAILVDPKLENPRGALHRAIVTEGKTTTVHPQIEVKARSPEQAREFLMHEIQHVIQHDEDFAKGGNWKTGLSTEDLSRISDPSIPDEEYNAIVGRGRDMYSRLAGEIEARDTQARSTKPYALRRQNFEKAVSLINRAREIGRKFDHDARAWEGSPEAARVTRINDKLEELGFGRKNMAGGEWRALARGDMEGFSPKPYSSEPIPKENAIVRFQLKDAEPIHKTPDTPEEFEVQAKKFINPDQEDLFSWPGHDTLDRNERAATQRARAELGRIADEDAGGSAGSVQPAGGSPDPGRGTSAVPGAPRVVASLLKGFKEKGYVSLRGQPASSSEDIVRLARVWRNPHFETFRLIFLKDGKIVGHEGVTQRIPNQSAILKADPKNQHRMRTYYNMGDIDQARQVREIYELRRRADRMGADEIVMMHNHPSGNVTPSDSDFRATKMMMSLLGPKAKKHIVIDHDKFTEIGTDMRGVEHPLSGVEDVDPLRGGGDSHEGLGIPVRSSTDVARIIKTLTEDPKSVDLVFLNGQNVSNMITAWPEGYFAPKAKEALRTRMRSMARNTGSASVVARFMSPQHEPFMRELIRDGILLDAVDAHGRSLRKDIPDVRGSLFGSGREKTYRVGEDPRYQLKDVGEDEPLGEGKATGKPPRVDQRVTDLRRAESAHGYPPSTLAREDVESWEKLDPEVRTLLREKTADDFMAIVKKGESLRSAEVMAFDALVRGKRERTEELRQAALAAPDNALAKQEYLGAQLDYIAAEKAMINDGTGTARALAARNRIMRGRGQDNDANMIRKISKDVPGLSDKVVGELVRIWRESPEKFPDALRQAMSFGKADKALELWKAGLLSAPSTDLANIAGNALEHATRMVEAALSGGVDWAIQKMHGGERARFVADAAAEYSGTQEAFMPALRDFARGMKDVALLKDKPIDMGAKFEFQTGAVGGPVGKVARTSFRKLEVEDQFFKDLIAKAELRKQAQRLALGEGKKGKAAMQRALEIEKEVYQKPEDYTALLRDVKEAQQVRTFQGETGPLAKAILHMNQTVKSVQVILPFVKTPANILRTTLERSPAGWGKAIKAFQAYRTAVKGDVKPAEVQKLRGAAADAISRATLGTAMLAGFAGYAASGGMTGGGPTNAKEKNLLRETGWQPYSFVVKMGGKKHYVPFSRFEPIASLLGFAADLAEIRDQKDAGDAAEKAVGAVVENLVSKSYLQGLSDAAAFITEPKIFGRQYISNMVGSLVPNIVNRAAKAVDPVVRDVTPEKTGFLGYPEAAARTLESRIPFVSKSLPARRNGTGDEIKRPGSTLGRFAGPVQISTEKEGAAAREDLLALGYAPSQPPREVTVPGTGKKVRVTDEEFEILAQARRRAMERFEAATSREGWDKVPADRRQKLARTIFDKEMDNAKDRIMPALRRRLKTNLKAEAKP